MTSQKPRPRWFFLVTPRWLAWHAFAVVAAFGMLWLGDWQFHRAESGNPLSWAYTFEWPIFTVFGVVFWAKTIMDEWRTPGGTARSALALRHAGLQAHPDDVLALPGSVQIPAAVDPSADDDPELAAYNAYLASLNRRRPARAEVKP
jgi:hypothetical protein